MLGAAITVSAASVAASWFDVRTNRIPNAIPAALALAGAVEALRQGMAAFVTFAAILVLLLAAGTLLHSAGTVGGGDVKLIAASCATLGVRDGALFLGATLLAGGALAFTYAAAQGRLRETIVNVSAIALPLFAGVRPAPLHSKTKMPYALAIAAGSLAIVILTLRHQ